MNLNWTKLFPTNKKPNVLIRAKSSIHVRDINGVIRPLEPGDDLEVTFETSRELDASDVTILSGIGPKPTPVANPVPARPQPAPLPNGWDKLPGCFKEYHEISEDFRTAREHRQLITQCRIDSFGTANSIFGAKDARTVTSIRFTQDNPQGGIYHNTKIIDLESAEAQQLENYLRTAEDAAEDYLKRLSETKGLKFQRLYLECGNHGIDQAEELQALVDELATIGFEIFSIRVQALGLAEGHVRRLFSGSADAVKFAQFGGAYTGSLCFAGMAADGEMRRYVDDTVAETAGHLINQTARVAQLKPLLLEARKELAKTQKASMPAGLPA